MKRQAVAEELASIAKLLTAADYSHMAILRQRTIKDVEGYITYAIRNGKGLASSTDIQITRAWESVLRKLEIAQMEMKAAMKLEARVEETDDFS